MQLEKLQDQKPECHLEWPKHNNYYTAHNIIVIGGLDSTHPLGFIPSIGCVVVGHYSLSGKLEEDHFNFVEEGRSNFFPCIDQSTAKIPICVLTAIIKKLSFEGSTVIDATSESGKIVIIIG